MIEIGQRVECIDKECEHFGKNGTFTGYLANGLWVEFDDGRKSLYLPSSLKKISNNQ